MGCGFVVGVCAGVVGGVRRSRPAMMLTHGLPTPTHPQTQTPHPTPKQWCIRKFYAFDKPRAQGGKLLAYIFFTPCFRGGHVAGWNANVLRRDTTMEGTKNEGTKNGECGVLRAVWMAVGVQ